MRGQTPHGDLARSNSPELSRRGMFVVISVIQELGHRSDHFSSEEHLRTLHRGSWRTIFQSQPLGSVLPLEVRTDSTLLLNFGLTDYNSLNSLTVKFYSFVRTGGSNLSLIEPQLIFTNRLRLRSLSFPNEEVRLRLGMFTIRNNTDELSPSSRHCTTHLEANFELGTPVLGR